MKKIALPRTLLIPEGTIGNEAPVKKQLAQGEWYEFLVAIGPDEIATLLIHEDGVRALKNIAPEATWI